MLKNDETILQNNKTDEPTGTKQKKSIPKKRQSDELFRRPSSSTPTSRENQEYLQLFDRRYSDSNYVIKRTSALEKVNLAEEIRKLSDRLFMLSSINDELNSYNEQMHSSSDTTYDTVDPVKSHEDIKSTKENPEQLKNVKNSKFSATFNKTTSSNDTSKMNGSVTTTTAATATKKDDNSVSNAKAFTNTPIKSVVNDLNERMKILDDTPNLFKNMLNARADSLATNGCNPFKRATSTSSTSSSTASSINASTTTTSTSTHASVPWPITNRRTKFRITQLSRDVPIGSPDSHQTVFLEEAANSTKDCLLHLLEKYNSKDTRSISSIRRHQSISVGYGIADNLEYHSMNSINAFFKRNAHSGNTIKQLQAQIQAKHK